MDDALAHKRLSEIQELIDQYEDVYRRRFGRAGNPSLNSLFRKTEDQVRGRIRLARDVIEAMGEKGLAAKVEEHDEIVGHGFKQAREAIVEAVAILAQREELAEIVGPVGPRLSASELHQIIWGAAAGLWDDGHYRQAVQTAGTALEGLLQSTSGPAVAGENLAILFSPGEPTPGSPRFRLRGIDPNSKTWKSAHDGAAALVRGAFMGVRNLVSHPGWPEPSDSEALEMLAVLSYVAHLVDRCDEEKAN